MIDEKARTEHGARMDFDAGQESTDVGDEASESLQSMGPEPVRDAMEEEGMKTRITQEDFEGAASRRVTIQGSPDVPLEGFEHAMLAIE